LVILRGFALKDAFQTLGAMQQGGILIVGDHASNYVPVDIVLGIDSGLLEQHIAWDIGVAGVAAQMVDRFGFCALLGATSRLVVDLNRYPHEQAVIPLVSDGIAITGNHVLQKAREQRIQQYYHPYHTQLAALIVAMQPILLLSLHSFTPSLASNPEDKRPWELGVLYNQDDRAARIAIPCLEAAGLVVGDQLPYSGKHLNATMNRHGEGTNTPYLGIEMRQDLVSDHAGQARFAAILAATCAEIREKLAL
jgi:predicted N-formylglutamate amidohydrolase